MKFLVLQIFTIIAITLGVNGFKREFLHGRRINGNLLPPPIEDHQNTLEANAVRTLWFTQKLDHFSESDNTTFQQKYYVNDQYWKKETGPVFLFIGGEGAATISWMTYGHWVTVAREQSALLIQVEHRFYGDSVPSNDTSLENLRYLSSKQAIEDLATFIEAQNKDLKLNEKNRWILFGGSYAASLAAWTRERYPDLVFAAVASSGPVLAHFDFEDYLIIVGQSLAREGLECIEAILVSVEDLEGLLSQPKLLGIIDKKFNLCSPLAKYVNDSASIGSFFETIADSFAGIVQYNRYDPAIKQDQIQQICGILTDELIGDPIDCLAEALNHIQESDKCLDYTYPNLIDFYRNSPESSSSGARQWLYQTCTEFGFFQTSTAEPTIFGTKFNIDFFVGICQDVFDKSLNATSISSLIFDTNDYYGGLNNNATRVIYTHGTTDPWHALGILETDIPDTYAFYISGTSHCADLYFPREGDSRELNNVRSSISSIVDKWLKNN